MTATALAAVRRERPEPASGAALAAALPPGAHLVGHLREEAEIAAIAAALTDGGVPVVSAPALFDADGTLLLDVAAMAMFKRRLTLIADVLVVTAEELEELGGMPADDEDDAVLAAEMLLTLGPQVVVAIDRARRSAVAVHEDGAERIGPAERPIQAAVLAEGIALAFACGRCPVTAATAALKGL